MLHVRRRKRDVCTDARAYANSSPSVCEHVLRRIVRLLGGLLFVQYHGNLVRMQLRRLWLWRVPDCSSDAVAYVNADDGFCNGRADLATDHRTDARSCAVLQLGQRRGGRIRRCV